MKLRNKIVIGTVVTLVSLFFVTLGLARNEQKADDVLVLSDKNTVNLNMPIFGEAVRDVQLGLTEKSQHLSAKEPIYLFLNSPGGEIDSGHLILDTIAGLPQKVHTVTLFSASMSFVISQFLGTRYMLPSGVMMSHRAAGGMEGTIPGSFDSRMSLVYSNLMADDLTVSKRAGLSVEQYRNLIRDELWLNSQKASEMKFADKIVKVRCDSSMKGSYNEDVHILWFTIHIKFSKCPLITEPLGFDIEDPASKKQDKADKKNDKKKDDDKKDDKKTKADYFYEAQVREIVRAMFLDRPHFIKEYIETNKYKEVLK